MYSVRVRRMLRTALIPNALMGLKTLSFHAVRRERIWSVVMLICSMSVRRLVGRTVVESAWGMAETSNERSCSILAGPAPTQSMRLLSSDRIASTVLVRSVS
jgi:hypothetical protein